jgi:hypothetical protein
VSKKKKNPFWIWDDDRHRGKRGGGNSLCTQKSGAHSHRWRSTVLCYVTVKCKVPHNSRVSGLYGLKLWIMKEIQRDLYFCDYGIFKQLHNLGQYPRIVLFSNTKFRRLNSVSVFKWKVQSWPQQKKLAGIWREKLALSIRPIWVRSTWRWRQMQSPKRRVLKIEQDDGQCSELWQLRKHNISERG